MNKNNFYKYIFRKYKLILPVFFGGGKPSNNEIIIDIKIPNE